MLNGNAAEIVRTPTSPQQSSMLMRRVKVMRLRLPPLIGLAILAFAACRRAIPAPRLGAYADVHIVTDEADAALSIIDYRRRGQAVPEQAWQRLFDADGYRDLRRREIGMGRPFTDSAFRLFLLSDSLLARAEPLQRAVAEYRRIDISGSAERALAYLPPNASLRSRLYLEIKPRTNTFVYPVPSGPAIFLYVDPDAPRSRVEHNVVAHELHHIGLQQACRSSEASDNPATTARRYAGALGEGLAMLAAAGGPDADPHAESSSEVRERWQRDYANWPADLRRVEQFLLDVGEGRLTRADSIATAAAPFWGDAQGPWYTVGYAVAATVERARGRDAVRRNVCDPAGLLAEYNSVVRTNEQLASLPLWDERLIRILHP